MFITCRTKTQFSYESFDACSLQECAGQGTNVSLSNIEKVFPYIKNQVELYFTNIFYPSVLNFIYIY